MERHITLPLTEELARTLHAGDTVYLTGTIYTSRDAGHKRMCEALARGEELPFDPKDATIYYVGPTPAKPGQVIGSAGPTTSGRMDAYAPTMMSVGVLLWQRRTSSGSCRSHEEIQRRLLRSDRRSRSPSRQMHQECRTGCLRRPPVRSTPQTLCRRNAPRRDHRQRRQQPLRRRQSRIPQKP